MTSHDNTHNTVHNANAAKADASNEKNDNKIAEKSNTIRFEDIISDENILKALRGLKFTEPTQIQALSIPPALKGKDLIGQAKTGSGKTLAFGAPILCRMNPQIRSPQALILAPTRELCQQIAAELAKIAKFSNVKIAAVYGGASMRPQIEALRDSSIVVATPGRLCDHMDRKTINTSSIKFLVFDEADRMFDMGFMNDMEIIVKQLPAKRQTILFSATMPDAIKKLTAKYQHEPVHIKTNTHVEEHLLPQFYVKTDSASKFSLLVHLIKKEDPNLAIVFCPTKHLSRSLAKNLSMQGIDSDAMHGDLTQGQRENVIAGFKKGKIRVLVATDIAARGLDVKHVSHVFNYDVSRCAEDYVHRIGRTARAGASGKAITFVEGNEQRYWRDILKLPNVKVTELKVKEFEKAEFKRIPREDASQSKMSNRQMRDRDRVRRLGDRSRPFGSRSDDESPAAFGRGRQSDRSSDRSSYARGGRSDDRFGDKNRRYGGRSDDDSNGRNDSRRPFGKSYEWGSSRREDRSDSRGDRFESKSRADRNEDSSSSGVFTGYKGFRNKGFGEERFGARRDDGFKNRSDAAPEKNKHKSFDDIVFGKSNRPAYRSNNSEGRGFKKAWSPSNGSGDNRSGFKARQNDSAGARKEPFGKKSSFGDNARGKFSGPDKGRDSKYGDDKKKSGVPRRPNAGRRPINRKSRW